MDASRRSNRFDTENELYHPFGLLDNALRLRPWVNARFTAYEERALNDSSISRFVGSGGVKIATQFFRVFDCHSDLLEINKIRHIIKPEVSYSKVFEVSQRASLIQFDETDGFARRMILPLQLRTRNRFQTKRKEEICDFITWDIGTILPDILGE